MMKMGVEEHISKNLENSNENIYQTAWDWKAKLFQAIQCYGIDTVLL